MTIKQWIALVIIAIILACTMLGIAGVWGLINGDTAWQVFATLLVCAVGLGTAASVIDTFFKDT